jgi:hypothetical protein
MTGHLDIVAAIRNQTLKDSGSKCKNHKMDSTNTCLRSYDIYNLTSVWSLLQNIEKIMWGLCPSYLFSDK